MQKIKIANRIHLIMAQAKLIKSHFDSMADIGTDHGYLPYLMHFDGLVDLSILCDINEGPLKNARKTFLKHSQFKVDFRLGSGIEPLTKGEVELVVIAGMGGGLVQDIMNHDIEKSKSYPFYLIQPMTEQKQLRQFLMDNNFEILWDSFFTDANKYYELIVVSTVAGSNSSSDHNLVAVPCEDLEFGYRFRKDQVDHYFDFLNNKRNKYLHILNQVSKDKTSNKDKILECEEKLNSISKIEQSIKSL